MTVRLIAFFALATLISCRSNMTPAALKANITAKLEKQHGNYAVAFKDLSTGEEILIHEHELFHAASTMKVPVMIEMFKQVGEGKFSFADSVRIKNEFRSIVDSSTYNLKPSDDSEFEFYKILGQKRTWSDLMYPMITVSSNLATNMLIEKVGARNVTETMRSFGAIDILVIRGVEDSKAYARGLSNKVTAYDLMLIFEKMERGEIINPQASAAMVAILLDQKFNTIIPARLPPGTKVAHKTGWFNGTNHDGGIVFASGGKKYVLVLLSSNMKNEKKAIKTMAGISARMYKYVNR